MLGNASFSVKTPLTTKDIHNIINPESKLRLQMLSIVSRANDSLADLGVDISTSADVQTLNILIQTWEDEITMVETSNAWTGMLGWTERETNH